VLCERKQPRALASAENESQYIVVYPHVTKGTPTLLQSSGLMAFPRLSLIPREEKFYNDFKMLADELRKGASLLEAMLVPEPPLWDKADEVRDVEHRCDQLTHATIERLNRTFVTPIDREDIHTLARSLDDVMDAIDAAAGLVKLYGLTSVRFGARELAHLVAASADQVRLACDALEEREGIAPHSVEINRLENEADRIHQEAVKRLFDEERDPILVLKWKETLDLIEQATDRCEEVANVLEGVMVKHG